MSGLLSPAPSAPAIRLVVGGYLLMLIQSALLLLTASLDAHARMLVWTLAPVGFVCLFASLIGWPARRSRKGTRHVR
ncbi:hypothetical protein [Novosphingobium lindaniclasticum]